MARPRKTFIRPKRKRGGQPGNTNRLVHGRYQAYRPDMLDRCRMMQIQAEALIGCLHAVNCRDAAARGDPLPPPPRILGSKRGKPRKHWNRLAGKVLASLLPG